MTHTDSVGFSDEPLPITADDALGRGRFIESLAAVLDKVGTRSESTVVAVVGQWGLGKSSILAAVMAQMRRVNPDWIVQLGLEPRWIGYEAADCAVALSPNVYSGKGATEFGRFRQGAERRRTWSGRFGKLRCAGSSMARRS